MTEYMTISDLKKVLRIGNDKAYKLCGMKGFPSFRIGEGPWLIDPKGLEDWVAKLQKTNTKSVNVGLVISANADYTAEEMQQILEEMRKAAELRKVKEKRAARRAQKASGAKTEIKPVEPLAQ